MNYSDPEPPIMNQQSHPLQTESSKTNQIMELLMTII